MIIIAAIIVENFTFHTDNLREFYLKNIDNLDYNSIVDDRYM